MIEDFTSSSGPNNISLYTLRNSNGLIAQITNYGARLVSLWVPDRADNMSDVVLGYGSIAEYEKEKNYYGATCGRYANRIAKGRFTLDGVEYKLAVNNGENHLHGGEVGFESVVWKVEEVSSTKIVLSYLSKHMEEGYPGNLTTRLTYELTEENELSIDYFAATDRATVLNLTHHSFFNLKGEGEGDILDHLLQINAAAFTPLSEGSIPTGEIFPLEGTPLDFQQLRKLGERIDAADEQLKIGNGYDHNYVLNGEPGSLREVAELYEPDSGRSMKVLTAEPGMQLYTGNYLDGSEIGKSGKPYLRRGGICLETQHFPNSPNVATFPSVVLRPEEKYESKTIYKFSIVKD
ncbi:MAG: galactose mutarotase [Ekhidna sp.]|nr:galactose mutarotase [Ekhidna sp.]